MNSRDNTLVWSLNFLPTLMWNFRPVAPDLIYHPSFSTLTWAYENITSKVSSYHQTRSWLGTLQQAPLSRRVNSLVENSSMSTIYSIKEWLLWSKTTNLDDELLRCSLCWFITQLYNLFNPCLSITLRFPPLLSWLICKIYSQHLLPNWGECDVVHH
jgi:hypothetical protein